MIVRQFCNMLSSFVKIKTDSNVFVVPKQPYGAANQRSVLPQLCTHLFIYLFIYLVGANKGKIVFTDDMFECIDQ